MSLSTTCTGRSLVGTASFWSRLASLLLIMWLSACVGAGSDTPVQRSEAEEVARTYLTKLVAAEPDYGWSLLATQGQWDGYEHYESVIEEADWAAFLATVTSARRCDDGWRCQVCLNVPGGPESVPSFLVSAPRSTHAGIRFFNEPLECGNAELVVVLSSFPFSAHGVEVTPR